MVQVFYHYNNGVSRRGSHRRVFRSRRDADRWSDYMSRTYPKFQLDEVFVENDGHLK